MRVLVTGHRGYVGSVLVPMLSARGHTLFGADTDLFRRCAFPPAGPVPTLPPLAGRSDIRDLGSQDLAGLDAVIHLAGLSNDPLGELDSGLTLEINRDATLRLARASRDAGVGRFVFASTCSVYGAAGEEIVDERSVQRPQTAYARSKLEAETGLCELADSRFVVTSLRSGTVYGVSPRLRFDLVLNNLVAWAAATGKIRLKSDGMPWRPLLHVEDMARAFVAVLEAGSDAVAGQVFNVGLTAHNYRVADIAAMVGKAVPGATIAYEGSGRADTRSYRVNCDKIETALPALKPAWTPGRGSEQVARALSAFPVEPEQFEGTAFSRVAHLRHLLETGQVTPSLRWHRRAAP